MINKKPKILQIKNIAKSKLFSIKSIKLKFSNGNKRNFEHINSNFNESVFIIPIINNNLILIKEYAIGIKNYYISFPKGTIEKNETPKNAAIRELREEIGYSSKNIKQVAKLITSPNYFFGKITFFIAKNLYKSKKKGDEPELIKQIQWPINNAMALLNKPKFNEIRNIAALFFIQKYINITDTN